MTAVWFGYDPVARTCDMAFVLDVKLSMLFHALSAELADDVSGAVIAFVWFD